ncbi:MAG: hypothetical protein WBF87_07625 [Mesorhizobium sp.]
MSNEVTEFSARASRNGPNGDEPQSSGAFSDLVGWVWSARAWFLYPALAVALASLAVLVIVTMLAPSTTSYRFTLSLNMPGAADGKYPSGMSYSPSDMRSQSVLSEVYKRNRLDQFGMTDADFASMVAVEAYSPMQESIVDRFRSQLTVRNITPEERQRLGSEFSAALRSAASDGALVTFTVPDNFMLPRELGEKVIADIPAVWSDIYINVLGVGSPALARSESGVLDRDYAKTLDYPMAYDYAAGGLSRLVDRLNDVRAQRGAANAVDPAKNQTALDILNKAQRIRDIEFALVLRPIVDSGLTRDKALTTLSYEYTLAKMKDDEQLALRRADIVAGIVAEGSLNQNADAAVSPSPTSPAPVVPLSPSVTSIPQFGDIFIDRIVSMALSGAGADFRQELLKQKLALGESAASIAKERVETERRLNAIKGFDPSNPSMAAAADRFSTALTTVIENINELWMDTNGILQVIGTRNINSDGQLYSSLPTTRAVSRTDTWRSPYLLIGALGATLIAGLLGMAVVGLRGMIGSRRRS